MLHVVSVFCAALALSSCHPPTQYFSGPLVDTPRPNRSSSSPPVVSRPPVKVDDLKVLQHQLRQTLEELPPRPGAQASEMDVQ